MRTAKSRCKSIYGETVWPPSTQHAQTQPNKHANEAQEPPCQRLASSSPQSLLMASLRRFTPGPNPLPMSQKKDPTNAHGRIGADPTVLNQAASNAICASGVGAWAAGRGSPSHTVSVPFDMSILCNSPIALTHGASICWTFLHRMEPKHDPRFDRKKPYVGRLVVQRKRTLGFYR